MAVSLAECREADQGLVEPASIIRRFPGVRCFPARLRIRTSPLATSLPSISVFTVNLGFLSFAQGQLLQFPLLFRLSLGKLLLPPCLRRNGGVRHVGVIQLKTGALESGRDLLAQSIERALLAVLHCIRWRIACVLRFNGASDHIFRHPQAFQSATVTKIAEEISRRVQATGIHNLGKVTRRQRTSVKVESSGRRAQKAMQGRFLFNE
mmetsp:Transcript_24969/g.66434  ORF Transcript_24969/g.66434 Transcript_24969/m.66434 type:complete len:208 (+) Transcript_24969:1055-1678(+)